MASLDQPKVSAKTTGQGSRSANSRIKVLLRVPPPQTIANEGRDGNSGSTPAMPAAVKAVSVAAASSVARLSTKAPEKSLRSSDFGGEAAKKGSARRALKTPPSAVPWAAMAPSRSKGRPRRFNIKSSSNPLPGPVSQAIGSFPGAIKLKLATPPILMNATGSKTRAVADLHGQTAPRPVQNGVTVKADEIDRGAVDGVRREKGFDRFHVTARDQGVSQRQAARPRLAVLEQGRVPGSAAQQRPVRLGIGKKSGAAKPDNLMPVGLDDRDVDAIHRGAAHQAYPRGSEEWLLSRSWSGSSYDYPRARIAECNPRASCQASQTSNPKGLSTRQGSLTVRLGINGVQMIFSFFLIFFAATNKTAWKAKVTRCNALPFPLNLTAS